MEWTKKLRLKTILPRQIQRLKKDTVLTKMLYKEKKKINV